MTNQLIYQPNKIVDLAEGSPDGQEKTEPKNPLKTTTVPTISGSQDKPGQSSETGVATTLKLDGEGKDVEDEQDASLTQDETKAEPSSADNEDESANNKPRALIVEDTQELAEVIQATLESMGLEAEYVTHGNKGLEKLDEIKPNVVLLDIGLPDMIGWKILDSIKEIYTDPNAGKMPTVIIITAYGDPANRLVAKLQGIHSYLIKPFTPDQVEKVVSSALSSAG